MWLLRFLEDLFEGLLDFLGILPSEDSSMRSGAVRKLETPDEKQQRQDDKTHEEYLKTLEDLRRYREEHGECD